MNETSFDNKCSILSELWLDYRDDEEFQDFIEYNDIGLPLSFMIASGIVKSTDKAKALIEETWLLFLQGLEVEEDTGFENLNDVLDSL